GTIQCEGQHAGLFVENGSKRPRCHGPLRNFRSWLASGETAYNNDSNSESFSSEPEKLNGKHVVLHSGFQIQFKNKHKTHPSIGCLAVPSLCQAASCLGPWPIHS